MIDRPYHVGREDIAFRTLFKVTLTPKAHNSRSIGCGRDPVSPHASSHHFCLPHFLLLLPFIRRICTYRYRCQKPTMPLPSQAVHTLPTVRSPLGETATRGNASSPTNAHNQNNINPIDLTSSPTQQNQQENAREPAPSANLHPTTMATKMTSTSQISMSGACHRQITPTRSDERFIV